MDLAEAAARAARFLQEHLAAHPPDAADDLTITLLRVTPSDEGGLEAAFGASVPFRLGDTRAIERINGCLRALHAAHPDLRAVPIEVTADAIER